MTILREASKIKGISSDELIFHISSKAIERFCKEFQIKRKLQSRKFPKEHQDHRENLETLKETIIKDALPRIDKDLEDLANSEFKI